MSSSDFRQIGHGAEPGKAERLFRAAVSAFCALTRPSRREIAQLEDLALPLFDCVSKDSRRYVAAALSDIAHAPAALVRRLCDEPVSVAAPLLIRSTALTDIDLIALIGRHGLPHARAIGRRRDLNPTIANLVRALERPSLVKSDRQEIAMQAPAPTPAAATAEAVPAAVPAPSSDTAAEGIRRRLRTMMMPSGGDGSLATDPLTRNAIFTKLRATALTGHVGYFQTALADALGIDFLQARSITQATGYADLILALRTLDLEAEQAFLLAAAVFPACFGHAEGIRLFVDRYRLCHPEAARERLRGWRAETLAAALARDSGSPGPGGTDADRPEPAAEAKILKAS